MRSIKELLQVMLENQHHFSHGLCCWNSTLEYEGIITSDESGELRLYIRENKPSKFSSIDAWKNRNINYYWSVGNIKPRIMWINKHIKKLK